MTQKKSGLIPFLVLSCTSSMWARERRDPSVCRSGRWPSRFSGTPLYRRLMDEGRILRVRA